MKVKLFHIYHCKDAFSKIANASLPIKISWKLSRYIKSIEDLYVSIDQQRTKLIEKLGESEDDGSLRVKQQNIQQFQSEFGELLQTDVEVDMEPISLEWLEDIKLSPVETSTLVEFLTD